MKKETSKITLLAMLFVLVYAFTSTESYAGGAGTAGAGTGTPQTGQTDTSMAGEAKNVTFSKEQGMTSDRPFVAKPNDYMLDMITNIIGGQAMSYVFTNATGSSGGKLFEGYTVKRDAPDTTVFTHILGRLLEGVIACSAILISWSYLLTSSATAQDGEFLGKKHDSSFLPFRTGLSVVSVAPIDAFGGLSFMQYIVVCAMCLGVIFAGYLSSAVVNFTVDQSLNELKAELRGKDIAPTLKALLDADVSCYFLAQPQTNKTQMIGNNKTEARHLTKKDGETYTVEMCERVEPSFFASFFGDKFLIKLSASGPGIGGQYTAATQLQGKATVAVKMKEEAEKVGDYIRSKSLVLLTSIAMNPLYKQLRTDTMRLMEYKYAQMNDPELKKDPELEAMKNTVGPLFDKALKDITDSFNAQHMSQYRKPEKLIAYSQELKDTLNSQGFATLGGMLFILLDIESSISNVANNSLFRIERNIDLVELGIIDEDDNGADNEVLSQYNSYQEFYSSLFSSSHAPFADNFSTQSSMKALTKGSWFEGDWAAQLILRWLGMKSGPDSDAPGTSGAPIMFELRNMGNNALGLATVLAVMTAGAQGSYDATMTSWAPLPMKAVWLGMIGGLIKMFSALVPYLFVLGFMLAFVLPALPWFFWVTAMVGLIIFFAEALIAINIWAIALAHPDGEGPTSSASSQGIQLLIRLTFQPSVIVVSFAFAMVAVDVVSTFVSVFTFSALAGAMSSVFSFVGITVMYMVILLSVTWTIYGVLSQMSSQVFGWIGQASHDMGEAKGEQNFMAAMNSSKQVSHAAGGAASAGGSGGKKGKPGKEEE